jgi:hypothetical protein
MAEHNKGGGFITRAQKKLTRTKTKVRRIIINIEIDATMQFLLLLESVNKHNIYKCIGYT